MAQSSDGCLARASKEASATLYLIEELGDARLRCDQLMRYIDEAVKLIEKSSKKDHFMEVAGHLITGMPETAFKLQKALQAVALAADRIDYEELKQELRPEKVEELERVLKEVRIRPVQHRSENPMITPKQAAVRLREFARIAREEGSLPLHDVAAFISELDPTRQASTALPVADALDKLAGVLDAPTTQSVTRQQLATLLSRMAMESEFDSTLSTVKSASKPKLTQEMMQLADVEEVKKKFKAENPSISDADLNEIAKQWSANKDVVKDKKALTAADQTLVENFESIRTQAITAARAANVSRWRPALLGLYYIVDEIGTVLVKLGSMDTQKSEALKREIRQQLPQAAKNVEEMSEFSIQAASAEGHTFTVSPYKMGDGRGKFQIVVKGPDKKEKAYRKLFDSESAADGVVKDLVKGLKNGEGLRDESWEKKAAAIDPWKVDASVTEDAKRSRFEEGKPADPTKNMDKDDAAQWKDNTEEHKDKFKTASGDAVAAGKLTSHLKGKSGHTLCGEKAYPDTIVDSVKDCSCYYCKQAWEKSQKSASGDLAWKVGLGPDSGHYSKFEKDKPADPTENMAPDDAAKWKTEHDKNKDQFKAAADKQLVDKLKVLLVPAERSLGFGNDWKGDFEGFKLWVGEPGGSRRKQYDIRVLDGKGRSWEDGTKSFGSVANKLAEGIEYLKDKASKTASDALAWKVG